MKEKRSIVEDIISETLEITAPVVLIENEYGQDEADLERDGDFTRLPNGELQPKNLYNACAKLLEKNSDRFGLMTLNTCFTKTRKDCAAKGYEVVVKDAEKEPLSTKEEEFLEFFKNLGKAGKKIESNLFCLIMRFLINLF